MRNYISPIIKNKYPDFLKSDFQKLAAFLTHFYEFLEENGNPLEILETFFENTEVCNQVSGFIDKILLELGFDIDNEITIPKKELVIHLREFYLSKGNEKSFRFLFKLLFNENAAVDYPRKKLFVLSQATYDSRYFIFTTATQKNNENFLTIFNNINEYSVEIHGISSRCHIDY